MDTNDTTGMGCQVQWREGTKSESRPVGRSVFLTSKLVHITFPDEER